MSNGDVAQRRLTYARISAAADVIDAEFSETPQFECQPLSAELGCKAVLKVETLNPIRCFKGRGADWLMHAADRAGDDRPIVCASAGNFGQAMAIAAARRDRAMTIFAAKPANPLKIDRMRALGGTVVIAGDDFDAAKAEARAHAEREGARFVEDSRDVETAEGAGTIGLELSTLRDPLDAVVVPIGNGAMINGIATALKHTTPEMKVIGVQASGAPAMAESWRQDRIVETATADTIADGIAVRVPVAEAVADMRGLIDDVVLVDDDTTIKGMRLLHDHAGLVAEPSAGIAIGAALTHPDMFMDERVGFIVCGGNVSPKQMSQWLG
ncbi:MAG: pyridoxal-phosphate dependent enzyme [Pseudomonadota bacterium]